MTQKKLTAGGEVDAWCTKCKLDLGHRIIAMLGDVPKRVECQTCKSHHNYYKPKSAPAAAAPKKRAAAAASTRTPRNEGERALARQKVENDREREWERLVSGRAPTDFKPYRPTTTFELGLLVRHPKFGDGYVVKVLDRAKVEVMFRDGVRTLAQGVGT